jgi:hypothetical protein
MAFPDNKVNREVTSQSSLPQKPSLKDNYNIETLIPHALDLAEKLKDHFAIMLEVINCQNKNLFQETAKLKSESEFLMMLIRSLPRMMDPK